MKPLAIAEVHFERTFSFEQSRHYASLLPRLRTERPEFAIYHECFERLVCETLIARGECTTLELLSTTHEPGELTPRRFLLGFNNHSPKRVRQSKELFSRFEANEADFLAKKRYLSTEYAQDFLVAEQDRASKRRKLPKPALELLARRALHDKVRRFVNIFTNIRRAGGLVGSADKPEPSAIVRYYDVPWAIRYGDYDRLRDGAHRRSVYGYLGEATIPTLVVHFDQVTPEHLRAFPRYLSEHFKWYKDVVEAVRD